MKKYWQIAKITWQEMSIYRLNFVMWRIRVVLQLLMVYVLWSSVFSSNQQIFGYTRSLMLTYVFGTSFISAIVTSSKTIGVGEDIVEGNLTNLLIRPLNYFWYWFARDLGDKTMNIIFSVTELVILFFILNPPLFIQTDISILVLTFVSVLFAIILVFFFNFLFGFIGFWSVEIWAPRFIFYVVLFFFAGGFFPLDILPKQFVNFFSYTPFPYILYFPLKIYLGQLSNFEILFGLLISLFWCFILFFTVKYIWKLGLSEYTAHGR